jgi:multisubunit Na+/H+ antiporter MnhF subunit
MLDVMPGAFMVIAMAEPTISMLRLAQGTVFDQVVALDCSA